ncbi:GAF domain-containing hybrid sensor histidine kinase/response regulator [Lichenibacterium ramalinae]|uniref:histidine kinase n=1 Tax=Lichenibacterium ramalinae TaxID=2316527 RepID=A0A4Q2R9I8_9HYPH|nr:ATP-binding protein [Lichenibacterium ramalinae]RYB01508.1 response regulator [Lichenibacterium ramalinae]
MDVATASGDVSHSLVLIERERQVLSQLARGIPLAQVLDGLLRAVEAQSDHAMLTSILFLSEDGRHLNHGAAPSLPGAYNEAIDGIAVGEGAGSCGTVASRGTPVYAIDIATDPLWAPFRELALSHRLRACWSTPIKGSDGGILGTFAIYYDSPRSPTQDDIEAIAFVTQTAALAIERHRHDLRLRRAQEAADALNAELQVANRTLRERILREQEDADRLTTAIEVARLGTYVWNATTGDVVLDARSRTIFGLPQQGPVRQEDVFARIAPGDLERVFAVARVGLTSGERVEVDYALVWPDGTRREVRSLGDCRPNLLGERCMVGVFHDITNERRIEEALRAEKLRLERQVTRSTLEREQAWRLSQELLVTALPVGTIENVNPAWTRLLGWDEHEIVGKPFVAFTHPDDLDATLAAFAGIFERPLVVPYEYRFRHKDGTYRWFGWTGTFENGKIYAAGRDTTLERVQAEALRQSQKMEAVGQLTGGLAHDFNNLLAGISGSLELMQTRMQQGRLTDVDRYMTAAQGAAKRAAALTHRLLAFSRRQTLAPKPTDVSRLATGMHDLIQRTVGPGIPVEVVSATNGWPALVDPPQLENALLNLCINARDAMPDGGTITIETANKWMDDRAARQHDMPEGQYLSLAVTDTGTGMPPEVIARVFEPFFTTKPIGEGTGLGLSMIYGFAQQSGGQVRIYSEVGQGTTVCIYLPRHYGAVEDEAAGESVTEHPRSEQGETVLVVDDEPTVRMLITDILEDLGFRSIEAGDSATGLRVLQSDVRIDLLVTDVGLPGGMNGRQMADAARSHRPDLKVLFITGYAENAILGNGTLPPGMAVLTKPFAMDDMAARIRSMIEGSKEQIRRS